MSLTYINHLPSCRVVSCRVVITPAVIQAPEDMVASRIPCVLVLALVAGMLFMLETLPMVANGKELAELSHRETVRDSNGRLEELGSSRTDLGARRSKRHEQPNCGGCQRRWAAERACFSHREETVKVPVLCVPPVTRRRCWTQKTVRHLVQHCCSGYHAEGIYCYINCGGCYKPSGYWDYACRKKETLYRTHKYVCSGFWKTKRMCTQRLAYTVYTKETYCCDGYVKDRGYCRRDTMHEG